VIQVNDEPQRKVKRSVTWLHEYHGGRTFYTSMGTSDDFKDEDFRRLLVNAIFSTPDAMHRPRKSKSGETKADNHSSRRRTRLG
jgi:hypothetical protein